MFKINNELIRSFIVICVLSGIVDVGIELFLLKGVFYLVKKRCWISKILCVWVVVWVFGLSLWEILC